MKPLRLVATALGPYPGEQVLDFRELGDRTLFLIHGPTGSGKTTILDAISFALYGECSGGEREIKRMRSDYADPATATEVTLDFRLGNDTYRVYRCPEQQRPRKRGEGMALSRAVASLHKRTGIEDDSVEGDVVASQWNKVTDAVERLLGFRSDQFRQVVMLPQGQFRRLLMADSKERQAILEVLFQTELYRRIEEALKRASKDLESQVKSKRQHLQFLLDQAETESVDHLVDLHREMAAGLVEIQKNLEDLKSREKQAQEELGEGRRTAEKFEELSRAQRSLHVLEKRIEVISKRRGVLDKARRALPIVTEEKALQRRSEESVEAGGKLQAARGALKAASEAKETAEQALDRENAQQEAREEARRRLDHLKDLTEKVGELDEAGKRLGEAQARSTERADEFMEAVKRLEGCNTRIDKNRAEREQIKDAAAQTGVLRLRSQKAEENTGLHDRLLKLGDEEAAIAQQLLGAQERLDRTLQTWERESAHLASLEKAWIEGQAAILAQQLNPGDPCPVCGSREHPVPAHSDAPLTDERKVTARRKKLEEIRKALDDIRQEKADLDKQISKVQAEATMLRESLGDLADKDRVYMEAERNRIRKELTAAERAGKKNETLTKEQEKLRHALVEAQKNRDGAEAARAEALAELKSAEAELRTRKEGIPEEFINLETLRHAQRKAQSKLVKLEEAFEKARKQLARAGERLASCGAAAAAAEDAAVQASQRVLIQRQEFDQSLREAGFVDEEDYASSKRTSAEIAGMQKEIDDFDHALTSARDRVARARETTEGLAVPDLNTLEAQARRIRNDLEKALREEAALTARIKRTAGILEEYAGSSSDLEALEDQYGVCGRIAEVANGGNPQGITFQRFVLAALLDDVLLAASRRLQIMSNRRYALQRSAERSDRRTTGGLDLEVSDSYTGTTRPVSTLSGGESFLASLSLALGLSDVVQAYAGGIHLDTIFVDEGFGSLDPEALDLAFRALADLQRAGRLVGIISHVPDLRERIDTRLEVTANRSGSKARFVV